MIVPETYHVPFCATHAQTFFASERISGLAATEHARNRTLPDQSPRQNECTGLSHARIVSTREGLVPIKFAMETTARQNGGNLNSLCLSSFCDDKDNTTLIRFKF